MLELMCPYCGPSSIHIDKPGLKCQQHEAYYVAAKAIREAETDRFLGQVLGGQYLLFDRIGQGGMGSVYKAIHLGLKRYVAVKMIRSQQIVASEPERLVDRFKFEAQSLSRLSHRNIVTVYDYGETSGLLYLVLEYVDGRTLASLIHERKRLSLTEVIPIVSQLLDALGELHRENIVHRDIKPSNLMLESGHEQTRLVLIDFGLAKGRNAITGDFRRDLTRMGMAVGTPLYMSPEVLQDGKLGTWSDLYAAGVLLYQLLAGRAPFTGKSAQIIAAHISDPIPALPAELGLPQVDVIIAKAMAKEPTDRFESALSFKTALLDLYNGEHLDDDRSRTQVSSFPGDYSEPESIATPLHSADLQFESENIGSFPIIDATQSVSEPAPSKQRPTSEREQGKKVSASKFASAVTQPHHIDFASRAPAREGKGRFAAIELLILLAAVAALVSIVYTVVIKSNEPDTSVDSKTTPASEQDKAQTSVPDVGL